MDTKEIMRDMLKNKWTKRLFRGVYPSDKLPKRVKKPALVIANTDDSKNPGQHWVGFYFPTKGVSEFFDSTGERPSKPDFIKFLKQNGDKFIFNTKRIQGSFSMTCGNYCTVYLLYRARKISKQKFFKLFTNNYASNDDKIIEMYRKNFRKDEQVGANSVIWNQNCQPQQ